MITLHLKIERDETETAELLMGRFRFLPFILNSVKIKYFTAFYYIYHLETPESEGPIWPESTKAKCGVRKLVWISEPHSLLLVIQVVIQLNMRQLLNRSH